jgi:NAD(P)-dependent dehydrogenase (short-subunit alcohol dehydrogenase family)
LIHDTLLARTPQREKTDDMKIAELFDVRGLATVVTGGASGIGLACARVMLANGARVCLVDRDAEALEQARAELRQTSNDVTTQLADVADERSINAAIDGAVAHFGALDVIFINAGIGGGPGYLRLTGERNPEGAIEAIPEGLWRNIIGVNLGSVFLTLQGAARHMRPQRRGSIIVTTSVAAVKTENFVGTSYVAAKAGAAHLVKQVALELAGYDIRVNAIAPGSVRTGIGGGRMADPQVRARYAQANPLHRMASPDEMMGLALYLASPASSYVTGAQLVIDGGGSACMAE